MPGRSDVMIECEGLTKRFGTFTAVDHVSFSVTRGSIFGFLGPNGSGKSTVIRMLCGILEPTEGTARIGGHDVIEGERSDQGNDRLHVAKILALRRADREREPDLLRQALRPARQGVEAAAR